MTRKRTIRQALVVLGACSALVGTGSAGASPDIYPQRPVDDAAHVVYVDGLVLDRRSGAHVAVPPPGPSPAPRQATTPAQPLPTNPTPSFDWGDAAIGAGVGGAIVFLAAIALAVAGPSRAGKLALR